MSLEHIRLSQHARDQLIALKRRTGLKNWNVLCRWALCTSLAEPSDPSPADIPADSSVEMSWRVFGGEFRDVYAALIKDRCERAALGTSDEVLGKQFRLHLHRGIGYLIADKSLQHIADLLQKSTLGSQRNEHSGNP